MKLIENIIIKNKIKKFFQETEQYKTQNDLKTFEDFVFHNYNGMCGSTYGILTTAPKLLLVCSKSFLRYYRGLDMGLHDDFFEPKGMYSYNYYKLIIKENKYIQNYIKKFLKEDFI